MEILNETQRQLPLEALETTLEAFLEAEGVWQVVTLILCDDPFIQALNARDRGEDEPTDVLSYALLEPDDAAGTDRMPVTEQLGDVFISLDSAERQALEHGHGLLEEVLVLAAHGVTHLRGFDHEAEDAWQTFKDAEARILRLHRAAP